MAVSAQHINTVSTTIDLLKQHQIDQATARDALLPIFDLEENDYRYREILDFVDDILDGALLGDVSKRKCALQILEKANPAAS